MATVSIEFVSGANTYTNTRTVSGADLNRFLAALRTHYSMPSATDEEIAAFWSDRVFAEAKGIVREVEADAAEAAIVDIVLT